MFKESIACSLTYRPSVIQRIITRNEGGYFTIKKNKKTSNKAFDDVNFNNVYTILFLYNYSIIILL